METETSRNFLHRIFIFLAGAGLLLNVGFDFVAFRKNQESDHMGLRVANSFQTLVHLERLNHLLESTDFNTSKKSIQNEIDRINENQTEILNAIAVENLKNAIANSPQQAIEVSRQLRTATVEEIAKLQAADIVLDSQVESQMMRALIADLGLIGAMLLLFFLYLLAKRKVEQDLKSSLINLRESLINLESKAVRRKIASKMAVHDLKNPFGTIMGFAQLMQDDPKSFSSVTEFSNRIRQISERSLVLVETLLSENESEAMVKQKVDIIPIINDIASQLTIQASKKSQKIILEVKMKQAFLFADSLKLEEVISNLLSNAIKYSRHGTKIKIRVCDMNELIQIDFEDQGPGFTEDDKKNAFQFGKKLSAVPTDNESSTGYGLYIVKQIVEAFKGEVEIFDAMSGKGARIQIRLPRFQEKSSDSKTPKSEAKTVTEK